MEDYAEWTQRWDTLKYAVVSCQHNVESLCDRTEPGELAGAFETDAIEREGELLKVWRNAAETEVGDGLVHFKREDPNCRLSFQDVDRSAIPSTPDVLVGDGVGLEVFLRAGRLMPDHQPIHTVGDRSGPAIMSYGRAIDMFGMLDEPGEDWRQRSDPDAEPSIEESISQRSIAAEARPDVPEIQPEPRTEREHRTQGDWQSPAVPLLSQDGQWALFKSTKHMADTAILAQQYTALARAKEKSAKSSDSSTDASQDTVLEVGGWPSVEGLDWTGFTNWVSRCKEADKDFGRRTLPLWRSQRDKRNAAVGDGLERWTPLADFDDGSSKHPDPRKYYDGPPLGHLDLKKLGIKFETLKR